MKRNSWAVVTALGGLLVMGVVLLDVDPPRGRSVSKATTGATVSTQPTAFVGKVTAIQHPDGVPVVTVVGIEGSFVGRKETAIAVTNLAVGDTVRLIGVLAPGGKSFPAARPIAWTNSWP